MDWFAITTGRERKLDREPGVFISRYEVTGDSVPRLHPLALTPEDFLDVWAQMSWDEAVRWSTEPSATGLQQWHAKLKDIPPDAGGIELGHHASSAGSPYDS